MSRREHKPFTMALPPAAEVHYYGSSLLDDVQPVLLAEDATNAREAGTCCLCPRRYGRGERIARLPDGSGWAHVYCVGPA